ncbi:hypothetical protein K504DRAFT_452301 [Pleomassaria siparia CBS 279.74]|uniref:Small secreted protein n=1 Tax=Pleomassaria siparia CBS 279.74 TaxID=1314801 RepID=A0A6G1KGM4_9PLEO|nr:hypothetical protein K504DRAFT_452301 [Pleomassaria siparia CBS 279.74]
MKTVYITLFSAALIAAAPTAFVKPGPVVTTGTEDVVIPSINVDRRVEPTAEFAKRAAELRDSFLEVRHQGKKNAAAAVTAQGAAANGTDVAGAATGKKGKKAAAKAAKAQAAAGLAAQGAAANATDATGAATGKKGKKAAAKAAKAQAAADWI